MDKIIFTFMVVNMHTLEHPIYKATCINGCGHGYGNAVVEAVEDCRRQVANLLDICNKLNIPNEIINKDQFMAKTDSQIYGFQSWKTASVQWVELDYNQIMQTGIENG